MKENQKINNYIENYMKNFKPYKNGDWCYEDGILMKALLDMYQVTNDKKYYDFVNNYYDSMIEESGEIKNYKTTEFNIDNLASGIGLFDLYTMNPKEKYRGAIMEMKDQIDHHPRTSEGSFFHKAIYPNQIWMDGIYMGLVFYSKYAKGLVDTKSMLDIEHQLETLDNRLYDNNKKLFMHAYDETKSMQWADKNTGLSPNAWSRATGWVLMALVDIYEESGMDICKDLLIKIVDSIKPYLEDLMLYQVIDSKDPRNYTETSGSAMLSYALLKGTRLKMIKEKELGKKIFDKIIETKFDGLNLKDICKVAGLDNKNRTGSFDYYMSEPKIDNEVKGVAPFIMAYSEILR